MIINMACPKCGKQTTEYDEKKWSCLYCGNKFVYAPIQPSHTLIQSNVHIQGQATFKLDVENAKSSTAKMARMIEHDPDHFGKTISKNTRDIVEINRGISSHKIKKLIAQIIIILMGPLMALAALVAIVAIASKDFGPSGLVPLIFLSMLMLWPVLMFLSYRKQIRQDNLLIQSLQQATASLKRQNLMDTKVGDYLVCPHCEAALEYVPLNSPPPVDGLKHCLKCGSQFFVSGLISYPVLFKE